MRSALDLPVFTLALLLLIIIIGFGAIVSLGIPNRPSNFKYFPAG
jgi:hypothetical protein